MLTNLIVLPEIYSIYKFQKDCDLPGWIFSSGFYSITRTIDELSVVTAQADPDPGPETANCSRDWRIIKVKGPLDLSMVGVIADIAAILKKEQIPIFTVSTFNTDYFLVRQNDLSKAIKALREKGHMISTGQ